MRHSMALTNPAPCSVGLDPGAGLNLSPHQPWPSCGLSCGACCTGTGTGSQDTQGRVPTQMCLLRSTTSWSQGAACPRWPRNMQPPQRRLQRASQPVGTREQAACTCSTGRMWSNWEQQHCGALPLHTRGALPSCLPLLCGNDWRLRGHEAFSGIDLPFVLKNDGVGQLTPS